MSSEIYGYSISVLLINKDDFYGCVMGQGGVGLALRPVYTPVCQSPEGLASGFFLL